MAKVKPKMLCWLVTLFLGLAGSAVPASAATRIKDLVTVQGVRGNYLNGFGLVVGLKGSGDSKKSLTTSRAGANMLTRMGLKTMAEDMVPGAVAAVLVTAELPPFAKGGDLIDVKVSAIGDAKSLAGGTLILTPLKAGNSEVFAVAQGAVVVGQASGNGPQVLTVARVPQGASIEREFTPTLARDGVLTLNLRDPDFTTAARIAEAINLELKGFFAHAKDLSSVTVQIPPVYGAHPVEFVADLEKIGVDADHRSVVVLNERTGTVVMGAGVIINPVAIAHGDLTVRVNDKGASSKGGPTKRVVALGKQKGSERSETTVGDLVETLNALGVKPADLVGILQTLHAAGALQAELKFL